MPTLFDSSSGLVVTADWQTKKIFSFSEGQEWTNIGSLDQK
jgi:hypothetical protein